MKCGEKTGHVTRKGTSCQQTIGVDAAGCLWFVRGPKERSKLAFSGSVASRLKRCKPRGYKVPAFKDEAAVIAFAHDLAQTALTEPVDLKRVAEARGAAALAMQGFAVLVQRRLADGLARLEHGELAFGLLAQIRAADAPRRPLRWKSRPADVAMPAGPAEETAP